MTTLYDQRQAEIEARIDSGESLADVQEVIDRPGLNDDERAALELWARTLENFSPCFRRLVVFTPARSDV